MKLMKKTVGFFLVLLMCFQLCLSSFAANGPFDLTIREMFGYENRVYLVTNDTSIRSEPYVAGEKVGSLQKGTPIISKGLFTNAKGNNWVQLLDDNGMICWVFSGNLKEHSGHDYVDLAEYGFDGFEVCKECGKVHSYLPLNENGGIELSASDEAHIALAACSFAPLVGEVCDAGDAMLSLSEGDYVGFALSLASLIPVAGYAAWGGRVAKLADTANDVSITARMLKEGKIIEVVGVDNRNLLKVNMKAAFEATQDSRYAQEAGRAAHHIVEYSDQSEAAKAAREILEKYGIDINSAANGVSLCSNPAICLEAGGALHTGRHVNGYSDVVLKRLESALDSTSSFAMKEQRDALIDALDGIARDLQRGDLLLQKAA